MYGWLKEVGDILKVSNARSGVTGVGTQYAKGFVGKWGTRKELEGGDKQAGVEQKGGGLEN